MQNILVNMYICTYLYIYIYIRVCILYIYIHIYIYIYIYVCTYIYIYACIIVYLYIYVLYLFMYFAVQLCSSKSPDTGLCGGRYKDPHPKLPRPQGQPAMELTMNIDHILESTLQLDSPVRLRDKLPAGLRVLRPMMLQLPTSLPLGWQKLAWARGGIDAADMGSTLAAKATSVMVTPAMILQFESFCSSYWHLLL